MTDQAQWIELDKPYSIEKHGIVIVINGLWLKVLQTDGNRILCEKLDEVSCE